METARKCKLFRVRGDGRHEKHGGRGDLVNYDSPVILLVRTISLEGRVQKGTETQRCNLQQVFVRGKTLTGMTETHSRSDARLYPVTLRTITLCLVSVDLTLSFSVILCLLHFASGAFKGTDNCTYSAYYNRMLDSYPNSL